MEFIATDDQGIEIKALKEIKSLDIELAGNMKFVWHVRNGTYDKEIHSHGCRIYCPDTEFGGIVGAVNEVTANGYVKISGDTWRGIIDKEVVEPPSGSDYRIVSGEANSVIRTLFSGRYGKLIRVSTENSGLTVSNHKIDRDIHMMEAIETMLGTVGARIEIIYVQGPPNGVGYVSVKAVKVTDWSNDKEFSKDGKLNYNINDYRMGVNKLICLGAGELKERTRLYMYAWPDGSVKRTQYYSGLDVRSEVYDYSSAQSEADLIEGGTKRLKELMNYRTFKVSIPDSDDTSARYDIAIGDVVGGRDRLTDTLIQAPVTNKIYKRQGRTEKITYKLKGESD